MGFLTGRLSNGQVSALEGRVSSLELRSASTAVDRSLMLPQDQHVSERGPVILEGRSTPKAARHVAWAEAELGHDAASSHCSTEELIAQLQSRYERAFAILRNNLPT